jgi:hypothetical protein
VLLLHGPHAPSSSSSSAIECSCGVWGGVGAARSGGDVLRMSRSRFLIYGRNGDGTGGEGGASDMEDELT